IGAAAFVGWEIGMFIGELQIGKQTVNEMAESLWRMALFAGKDADALKQTEAATNRMAGALKTPIVREAGEDWKHYADRVQQAAKAEIDVAKAIAQADPVRQKQAASIKSHV